MRKRYPHLLELREAFILFLYQSKLITPGDELIPRPVYERVVRRNVFTLPIYDLCVATVGLLSRGLLKERPFPGKHHVHWRKCMHSFRLMLSSLELSQRGANTRLDVQSSYSEYDVQPYRIVQEGDQWPLHFSD